MRVVLFSVMCVSVLFIIILDPNTVLGGWLWMDDLLQPDPYFIMPVLVSTLFLANHLVSIFLVGLPLIVSYGNALVQSIIWEKASQILCRKYSDVVMVSFTYSCLRRFRMVQE